MSLAIMAPAQASAAADRDCGDFATQRQAQTFFVAHNPASDPHRLDSDGDGVACEDLRALWRLDGEPETTASNGEA